MKEWSFVLHQPELLEGDYNAPILKAPLLCSTHAYPIHLSIYTILPGLGPDAADANDSVEIEEPNSAHAIIDSEAASRIGIANVRPLVGQNAHTWLCPPPPNAS